MQLVLQHCWKTNVARFTTLSCNILRLLQVAWILTSDWVKLRRSSRRTREFRHLLQNKFAMWPHGPRSLCVTCGQWPLWPGLVSPVSPVTPRVPYVPCGFCGPCGPCGPIVLCCPFAALSLGGPCVPLCLLWFLWPLCSSCPRGPCVFCVEQGTLAKPAKTRHKFSEWPPNHQKPERGFEKFCVNSCTSLIATELDLSEEITGK